jgi:protein involved in temperature-dependent protein secretion
MEFLTGPLTLIFTFVGLSLWIPGDNIVFNPIVVAQSLEDRGFTSKVVTTSLSQEIRTIDRLASSNAVEDNKNDTAVEQLEDYFEVTKPVTAFSAIIRRRILGIHPDRVSGEVVEVKNGLSFRIRVAGHDNSHNEFLFNHSGQNVDIDQMVHEAAIKIVEIIDPYTLGVYYYYLEKVDSKFPKTLANVTHCLEKLPMNEHYQPYNLWGRVLLAEGKIKAAISKFQQSLKINPGFSAARLNWGTALAIEGHYNEAKNQFQKVIDHEPSYAPAYAQWGATLAAEGRHQDALAMFAKASEIDPNYDDVHMLWGDLLARLNNHQEALEQYLQAAVLDPDDKEYAARVRATLQVLYPKDSGQG